MKFELPNIPESQITPVVKRLLVLIEQLIEHTQKQQEDIDVLKDEIKVLKGQKKRPTFKASKLDKSTNVDKKSDNLAENDEVKKTKKSKETRRNKKNLPIHRSEPIKPDNIPEGSRFKGYQDFVVQELVIHNENICYRLERWLTPEGKLITGKLPTSLENRHYGPNLVSYLLYQHHHCQVTQPLLLEQLREWGIVISSGQINRLLSEGKERFHDEKEALLHVGLTHSDYVTVDDSGARHKGSNGYVTHIGNDFFAWFSSTSSKSRVNFLTLLNRKQCNYRLDKNALAYMEQHKMPKASFALLNDGTVREFPNNEAWLAHLSTLNIALSRHQRIATEGALMGALMHGSSIEQLAIISDGAGQFTILQHGLCWVHAERLIHNLLPMNECHKLAVEGVREKIWGLYRELKLYKLTPCAEQAVILSAQFDAIFQQKTAYVTLNQSLKRLYKLKDKLLLVLKRPEIPIHTNGSEGDIRDYVKKRKVSGGTRSDLGQQCRDTFASLKKTCRKLGISFWEYLHDRHHERKLPALSEIVKLRLSGICPTTSL
jgi:hypothetical protein